MRRLSVTALFCLLSLSSPALAASFITSTFAGGNTEGWTTVGGGVVRADGSYGGFLVFDYDANFPGPFVLQASGQFLGNLTRFDGGIIGFDVLHPDFEPTDPPILNFSPSEFGLITIIGSAGTVSLDLATGPRTGTFIDTRAVLASYSAPFDAATWGLPQAQWTSILADVQQITLSYTSGRPIGTTLGMDNFQVGSSDVNAIPEPSSAALSGIAVASILGYCRLRLRDARRKHQHHRGTEPVRAIGG